MRVLLDVVPVGPERGFCRRALRRGHRAVPRLGADTNPDLRPATRTPLTSLGLTCIILWEYTPEAGLSPPARSTTPSWATTTATSCTAAGCAATTAGSRRRRCCSTA